MLGKSKNEEIMILFWDLICRVKDETKKDMEKQVWMRIRVQNQPLFRISEQINIRLNK